MSDEESPKQVNVDPRCIQEALRMYLQPIKNDDPQLDFYTMYKRETMQYDTEYMNKYNEDLNTTLIFAGLFSAVSSAFVVAIQPELQPNAGQQSEAYLRAILLHLRPSISPDEHPAAPPAWSGPPQEVITTLALLYASLLMSLLAALVAMLGKQWLNRYLRHAGGSVIERCGDRQRKCEGLEEWPFHIFIESLPVMLQIALFLLASGLSRYMWSINTSVSAVIISLTVLCLLFYVVIVVIGTCSYYCPFQTPLSTTLRRVLPLFSASNLTSFIRATQRNARKILRNLTSFSRATRRALVPTLGRVYQVMRSPSSLNISPLGIVSGIPGQVRSLGQHIIVPFLLMFVNAKKRLVETLRGIRHTTVLPVVSGDTMAQQPVTQDVTDTGLRIHVWNFEALRRQNADNAGCVSWVLRNITDPEAIDSAIRLAGDIRWFDGSSKHGPPYDLIVSIFEACFDSTKAVYPGMRDRAYFSARAILQIHARARIQSEDYALKHPIPIVFPESVRPTDPDLCNVLDMLKSNTRKDGPTLFFPVVTPHTHAHLLWMSNLFLDLTRVGPNPKLVNYSSYLGIAASGDQAAIANTLIVWYLLLGGNVEEETFWAVDKSDSLEPIFSLLGPRVEIFIADGRGIEYLIFLLEFLAAWDKRPGFFTPMLYRWCSALFGVVERVDGSAESPSTWCGIFMDFPGCELLFWDVGLYYDGFRSGDARCSSEYPPIRKVYIYRLFQILAIGFRQVDPDHGGPALRLDHAYQSDRMFETIFSSDDDETIADAVCIWIVDHSGIPPGSLARYLARRVERAEPLSPRLRLVIIRAIGRFGASELEVSGLETIRLLNCLRADVDDISDKDGWANVLLSAMRSPEGVEILSSHCLCLLQKFVKLKPRFWGWRSGSRDVEVMKSLEKAGEWKILEVWVEIIWHGLLVPEWMEDIERVTLELLLHQPSALPRFEDLCNEDHLMDRGRLQELLPPKCPPRPQLIHATPLAPLHFGGDDTF